MDVRITSKKEADLVFRLVRDFLKKGCSMKDEMTAIEILYKLKNLKTYDSLQRD